MTYRIERLAELRRHLDHLEALGNPEPIERLCEIVRQMEGGDGVES